MGSGIGAVIIGADFQALGAVRSLSQEGVPVFLVEHERGICRYSRYVTRMARNYSLLSDGKFPDFLIDLAKKEGVEGWVLFPNDDECVKMLSICRDTLDGWYRNPVPSWDIVKKFYHKENAAQVAEEIGIPVPRRYQGKNLGDFLCQDLGFPLVLKPSCKEGFYPKVKRKAIRVDSREGFVREYKIMSSIIGPSAIVVQEMIEGGPKNLYSFATVFDGRNIIAGMAARRWRQHPMDFGHATTYAESVEVPELEILTQKLLREIGFYGLAEVEFMYDSREGVFKFIEINGRVWGWHTLAKAAGVNLPLVLFKLMTGDRTLSPKPRQGVKWVRFITDVPTVFKEIAGGRMTLGEYVDSLRGEKEFAVFSAKDPLPFFAEIMLSLYLWKKRGF
ncbi:MAG: hypothetical protein V1736_11975 [Pseudomonadota bacterium]